jgi:nucleoside-diphosphate-sugar epimerase
MYEENFPIVVLRLPGVVGPNTLMHRPWIATVLSQALINEPIHIYNKAKPFNNVVDVVELGRVMTILLDRGASGFEVFNLASRTPLPLQKIIEQIVNLSQSQSAIIELSGPHQSFYIDIDKIQRELQFQPETTNHMIKRFVQSNLN